MSIVERGKKLDEKITGWRRPSNDDVDGLGRSRKQTHYRLKDDGLIPNLVRTADEVYLRLHGPQRWYRHDYSDDELTEWAVRIKQCGARRAWVYFNNDCQGSAP
ncbi:MULTISPECIES: DUF72 domain-containing protein [unclassified Mesorhizobium]|uniref:DUF72 domain-containing protein n=1 Tax=unclassified Mesorhizobium TaxID=325217 RepID=UPI0016740E53|nr:MULTISPECIES: DUF72 domain-containing protein [unclassified Mesorhizobium]